MNCELGSTIYTDVESAELWILKKDIHTLQMMAWKPSHCCEWLVQGYGTVRFGTADATQAAISAFHQTDLQGRTLAVRLDRFA